MDYNEKESILATADMGYGYTKIWSNGKYFRQPAVLGEPRRIRDEDIKKDDVMYFVNTTDHDDLKYFIGDLAIRHSQVRYTSTAKDRAKAWITHILLEAGLALTSGSASVNLVTGLPVDYFFKQKADFEKMLNNFNEHENFTVRLGRGHVSDSIRPMINEFHIVPQPLGAFMNYHANDNGELMDASCAKKLWLVSDFGFGTYDQLVLEELEIKPGSGSPSGIAISEAYKLIREELMEQIGRSPDVYTLDHYIKNGIEYDGYDLTKLKNWAFDAVAAQAQNEIDSINRNFYGHIITGGWAEDMAARLKPMENTIVMDQLGNLKGYRKIGRRRWYRKQ